MKREIEQTGHRHHYLATRNRFFLVERTLVTLDIRAGVDPLAEDGEELGKESSVHVPGHLVENQPVSLGTTPDEVMNVAVILILAEVSPHFPLDQKITKPEYVKHGHLCSDHKIRKKGHVKSKFAVTIKNYWLR